MTAPAARKPLGGVHLLDGNVLYALIDEAHVHHRPAQQWFAGHAGGFATCPITQGSLLRLAMRLGRAQCGAGTGGAGRRHSACQAPFLA